MLVAQNHQLLYNVIGDFMKKPELLAPAGSFESLIAAIEGGCDAVYLSGKLYGARSFANNFDNDELVKAINIAHLYGVKVYVTINTLIYEDEVANFLKYVSFLHHANVDAVIIQDIGMFDLIHQMYPNLEIHISTQMHIHNLEGVKLVQELGAKRVVLARETPISLISEIKKQTDIEIEAFVHGALCVSYSGQCLMSSLIGGRSGNRGTCAQCCRQPYDLIVDNKKVNDKKYLLSMKDLMTLKHIDALIEAGIDSFKIEGRMKRPEYVYMVTSLYRKAIDSYFKTGQVMVTDNDISNIKSLFNREFTKGFIFDEDKTKITNPYRPNHLGIDIGKVLNYDGTKVTIKLTKPLCIKDGIRIVGVDDVGKEVDVIYLDGVKVKEAKTGAVVKIPFKGDISVGAKVIKTTDIKLIDDINKKIASQKRKVTVSLSMDAYIGKPLILKITDGINTCVTESDFIAQESITSPTSVLTIKDQLSKLGGTVFKASSISLNGDDNIFIPIKKINELRRKAISTLTEKRLYEIPVTKGEYQRDVQDFPKERVRTLGISKIEDYPKINKEKYQEIYVSHEIWDTYPHDNLILKIPRVQERLISEDVPLLIGELGSLYKYNHCVTDFSFNVVNSYSVALLHAMGARRVTLSYELNDYQIAKIIDAYHKRYQKHPNLELIVSGPIEVMVSKYKLLDKYHASRADAYLKDKFGNNFKVEEKDNLTYIYHYEKLSKENTQKYYDMGINSLRDEK